jgi:hypothetical protein
VCAVVECLNRRRIAILNAKVAVDAQERSCRQPGYGRREALPLPLLSQKIAINKKVVLMLLDCDYKVKNLYAVLIATRRFPRFVPDLEIRARFIAQIFRFWNSYKYGPVILSSVPHPFAFFWRMGGKPRPSTSRVHPEQTDS